MGTLIFDSNNNHLPYSFEVATRVESNTVYRQLPNWISTGQESNRILLLRPFPYLGSAHRIFTPRSPVLCFYVYSILSFVHVFSYNITPPQFRSSYLSVSTHFHVLITSSSSAFLSTCHNHASVSLLLFSHLCLPHLPLFLHSWSSQSSLFPSSTMRISSLFFLASFVQPFSEPWARIHESVIRRYDRS